MSNVIKFPKDGIKLERLYCEECSSPLQYWFCRDDDSSYGLCGRCDLHHPNEVTLFNHEIH